MHSRNVFNFNFVVGSTAEQLKGHGKKRRNVFNFNFVAGPTKHRELLGLKPRQRVPKGVVIQQSFGISTDPTGWDRAVQIDAALRDKNSVVTRGFRQELFVHRSCIPLPVIDFDVLAPDRLAPMSTGECQGMCGL